MPSNIPRKRYLSQNLEDWAHSTGLGTQSCAPGETQPRAGRTGEHLEQIVVLPGRELEATRRADLTYPTFRYFCDQIYYPCLEETVGRPYALCVHGNSDTTGAIRGVETITTGLRWKRLRELLSIVGEAEAAAREACWELGATAAASLMPDS
ncbi:hypothetical protein [Frankia sp. Cr1]|uniref:hypothetical protein n=1 Tax=Frankia sp. Cr1 TaxID=3073931 RepID=UPI002AD30CCD|nr:hypothetical protein [Frankia sp. Cr1]